MLRERPGGTVAEWCRQERPDEVAAAEELLARGAVEAARDGVPFADFLAD